MVVGDAPKLKTGLYCGYGWYGPAYEKECIKNGVLSDKKIRLKAGIDLEVEPDGGCGEKWYYVFWFEIEAMKKYPLGDWISYYTNIDLDASSRYVLIYPAQINDSIPCETCPGVQGYCHDWECKYAEIGLPSPFMGGICYVFGTVKHLPMVKNPISPNSITNTPLLQRVCMKATHEGMNDIYAVINYGYGGTQGCYCEQQ